MNKLISQRLIVDSLVYSAQKHPDKIAVIAEGIPHTYEELNKFSTKLANAMLAKGFCRGDRCVIFMDNTWECVVSIYATMIAGGVFVVVNPQTKSEKLSYILKDCGATSLITDSHLYSVFSSSIGLPSIRMIISSGDLEQINDARINGFYDFLNTKEVVPKSFQIIPNDLSALIYTSGSTGDPKGVMQTHQSMCFAMNSLIEYLRLSEDDRILLVLPLAFDYGLYQLLMSVQLSATLILERSFTYPAQIFKRIEEEFVTVFPAVPTIFSMMLSMHNRSPICFPSVKRITNTAAALPPEYLNTLKEIFPSALIYKMYGLTECKRVCYLEPEKVMEKPSSVGKAIPGTEVFILNDKREPVVPGETGILYVRGPHIMLGYWGLEEQSKEILIEGTLPGEKILCTRDWFKMDEDGDLYFQGRSDDIIKTRGEKVSPVEVENVIYGISGVREVAVIGVEDDVLGQAVKCFVALDEGSNLTVMDIKKICISKLENFMVPKYFEFVDELEKTNTGKISKKGIS